MSLFPNKTVHPIIGKPTKVTLDNLLDKCIKNLASVSSGLGSGDHGLTGLILCDAKYHRETGHHFIDPVYPGEIANTAMCANVADERRVRDQFHSDTSIFNKVTIAGQAIRNIVIEVIDTMYLDPLRLPLTGLASVPIREIFRTLMPQHGHVTSADRNQAEADAKSPWDPTTPVQNLFTQIQNAADLVEAAGDPFTDKQLVLKTASFTDALRAWRCKNEADKS